MTTALVRWEDRPQAANHLCKCGCEQMVRPGNDWLFGHAAAHARRSPLSERFWGKVEKSDECWEWVGATVSSGYGTIYANGRKRYVHRLSLEWKRGEPLGDLHALHHCDNPPCVNPDHLFAGTNADNQRDAIEKGRKSPPPVLHGERSRTAKLTEPEVLQVRERYKAGERQVDLADEFGVNRQAICKIVHRQTWKHI